MEHSEKTFVGLWVVQIFKIFSEDLPIWVATWRLLPKVCCGLVLLHRWKLFKYKLAINLTQQHLVAGQTMEAHYAHRQQYREWSKW